MINLSKHSFLTPSFYDKMILSFKSIKHNSNYTNLNNIEKEHIIYLLLNTDTHQLALQLLNI